MTKGRPMKMWETIEIVNVLTLVKLRTALWSFLIIYLYRYKEGVDSHDVSFGSLNKPDGE